LKLDPLRWTLGLRELLELIDLDGVGDGPSGRGIGGCVRGSEVLSGVPLNSAYVSVSALVTSNPERYLPGPFLSDLSMYSQMYPSRAQWSHTGRPPLHR
jgi:hypothetical protein